jgi:tRNA (guanosine-2'-O-)-methyltransferase
LVIAPLWVAYQANLGTLLRTCDATGACIAVPDTPHYRQALTVGDSRGLARRCCIHWINNGKDRWIRLQRQTGWQILAVELADDAIALPRLAPAAQPTVVLLGHETQGIPAEHLESADICVEIPIAMQKVEGSSPFSRFPKAPLLAGFFVGGWSAGGDERAALPLGSRRLATS